MRREHYNAIPAGCGFQLPSLHKEIPEHIVELSSAVPKTDLTRTLLELGVIDPALLDNSVTTTHEVLSKGMENWIKKQTDGLMYIRFDCGIMSAEKSNEFIRNAERDVEIDYKQPVFYIEQPGTEYFYEFKKYADQIEALQPGLVHTILSEIAECANYTLPIRSPEELFNEFCFSHYEGHDLSEALQKKNHREIRKVLKDRFGNEKNVIDAHMPNVAALEFGYECWRYKANAGQFDAAHLKKISAANKNRRIKSICTAIAALRRYKDNVIRLKASLPGMPDFYGSTPVFSACCLVYERTDMMQMTLDEILERGNQGDDNCEYFGFREMPTEANEIKSFFEKLEAAFTLLRQMDKLIELINEPDEHGNSTGRAFTIEGSAKDGMLRRAILLYDKPGSSRGSAETVLASIHEVGNVGTRARPNVQVLPGKPISKSALFNALQSLSTQFSIDSEILPEHLLSYSPFHLMWWRPAGNAHVFFNAQSIGKRAAVVPHPALLFLVCNQTWYVFAMNESKRPTGETILFNAPYFNVYQAGNVCIGSASIPDACTPSTIPFWENAFFESEFTHTNDSTSRLIKHETGPYGFWKEMLDGLYPTFPVEKLVQSTRTVGSLLAAVASKGANNG